MTWTLLFLLIVAAALDFVLGAMVFGKWWLDNTSQREARREILDLRRRLELLRSVVAQIGSDYPEVRDAVAELLRNAVAP